MSSEEDKKRAVEEAVQNTTIELTLVSIHESLAKREEATEKQWILITDLGKKVAVLEAGSKLAGGVSGGVAGIAGGGGLLVLYKIVELMFSN